MTEDNKNKKIKTDPLIQLADFSELKELYEELIFERESFHKKLVEEECKKTNAKFFFKYLILRPAALTLVWAFLAYLIYSSITNDSAPIFWLPHATFGLLGLFVYSVLHFRFFRERKEPKDLGQLTNDCISGQFKIEKDDVRFMKASRYIEATFYRKHVVFDSEYLESVPIELPFTVYAKEELKKKT